MCRTDQRIFNKLDEIKVMRDPIHGYIHVSYEVIWAIINHPIFQRLRRIKQMGSSYIVYHTAEHTRFAHSLGVYEIVQRMCYENKDIDEAIDEKDKIVVMLAALLHDIGHGPFSHAFESVFPFDHEAYSVKIIKESSLATLLDSYAPGLSQEVADIIAHKSSKSLLVSMISSQLDADRMDYLLRDAYFTGTKYGEYDLERVLRTLRVKDGKLVVKESGIHTIEDYIMARYHMYWQVYYHPVARSFEAILNKIFLRMQKLHAQDPSSLDDVAMFKALLNNEFTLQAHFLLDECACVYGFEKLIDHEDKIISDLCRRLRDRDLFEYEESEDVDVENIKEKLWSLGFDPEYYMAQDQVRQSPYQPYRGSDERGILILMADGKIKELSKASMIVNSLTKSISKNDHKIFFPREVME
ncbi:MAG: HD domain-containing protein [Erysipelotrichaceae bacterium]|nr:HD domain-containing protein [Erysipelotrichaceae bacterium]MDY5252530.1 HD domain-containing protein [Erysipelotrichaceae bacterium]